MPEEPIVVENGQLSVSVRLDAGQLRLTLTRGGQPVLENAEIGGWSEPVAELRVGSPQRHQETYTMRAGKQIGPRSVDHLLLETDVVLVDTTVWGLRVRVAPDGFAVSYRVPAGERFATERTSFRPTEGSRGWMLDYTTWYESERFGADLAELSTGDYGMPALLRLGSDGPHALVTEGAIDGRWSGTHMTWDGSAFVFMPAEPVTLAEAGWTPWRIFIIGDLATIVSSTLVEDLAPAADPDLAAADWIRPGRAVWSWWSSQYSGADAELQLAWADYAADQGWEHILVDCGWSDSWVPHLVERASARGIQVHVWSKWSDLVGPDLAKLARWASWGVAGIKVDFMESESQARHAWYDDIIAEAARVGLMINFHGSTIPRGWARSHPHVMTHEAIRGAEYYTFMGDPLTAAHNVIQPFTRNVIGSMDYTPVTFTAPGRETSDAHELALSIAYESSLLHFGDSVDAYAKTPIAQAVMREVPSVWDETVLLTGDPDHFAAIARRRADRWFIGVIATGDPCDLELDLSRLDAPGAMWVIEDGANGLTERVADSPSRLSLQLERHGGAVVVLAADRGRLQSARSRPLRANVEVEPRLQVLQPAGVSLLARVGDVQPDLVELRTPSGWTAERTGSSDGTIEWTIVPEDNPTSGSVAVVTVEVRHPNEAPQFVPAWIQAPYAEGSTAANTLTPVDARNGWGPVEVDGSNGGGDPDDGQLMTVAGTSYPSGFGTAVPAKIDFAAEGADRFGVAIAVDDETSQKSAEYQIWGDDQLLASGTVEGGQPPTELDLALPDVKLLSLRLPGHTGGPDTAHVDWLDPYFTR